MSNYFKIPDNAVTNVWICEGEKVNISYDLGDEFYKPCVIAYVIRWNNIKQLDEVFIIDSLVSPSKEDIKTFIEKYDPNYFSLDSINQRKKRDMSIRESS